MAEKGHVLEVPRVLHHDLEKIKGLNYFGGGENTQAFDILKNGFMTFL